MPFNVVAIWGMGLLGGSLGLALRTRGLANRIVGVGREGSRLLAAKELGACHDIATDPARAFPEADLSILCAPVAVIADSLPQLAPLFKPNSIVTDVGSTKARIVQAADSALAGRCQFVGSHPMSGSERSGVANAREDLFEGNPCFVTVSPQTSMEAMAAVSDLWSALGSHVVIAEPARHDSLAAVISHVPHLASSALALLAAQSGEDENYLAAVAGRGFWDMTRLAKGELEMWTEICAHNREPIVAGLDALIEQLHAARERIAGGEGVHEWLARARDHRLELDTLRPGVESQGDG